MAYKGRLSLFVQHFHPKVKPERPREDEAPAFAGASFGFVLFAYLVSP
jgi:hypothetical protein